jgi:hypothetical protein
MSEQSTYSNDPDDMDGQEGVLDRVGEGGALDTGGSEDIAGDSSGGGAVGTPASSDPDQMVDVGPDDLGGTGGENAGGAG